MRLQEKNNQGDCFQKRRKGAGLELSLINLIAFSDKIIEQCLYDAGNT